MGFTLFPAIDVVSGGLGVYTAGGPEPVAAFGGEPLAAAEAFAASGARWLHFVDMDAAFGTGGSNVELLRSLCERFPDVRFQASGGFLSWADVEPCLEAGAARVVLGSGALDDEAAVQGVLDRAGPGRAIVGIEVNEGRIRSRGAKAVDLDLMATLGWLDALRPPAYLLTAVGRVGELSGPDRELLLRVVRVGRPVLAAGGIRSLQDLAAVREDGATGAVVGRAALEGGLDLSEALAWASAP